MLGMPSPQSPNGQSGRTMCVAWTEQSASRHHLEVMMTQLPHNFSLGGGMQPTDASDNIMQCFVRLHDLFSLQDDLKVLFLPLQCPRELIDMHEQHHFSRRHV
eukprot:3681547-Amphidinium_carterae.3